jgi:predicted DNA binding CopG/RHH family protein
MKKNKYTSEENEIVDYIENKNPKSIPHIKKRISDLKKAAQNKVSKRIPINFRILEDDLRQIKKEAQIEGIPYQTLMSSIIHKYLNGNLISKKNYPRDLQGKAS